MPQCVWRLGQSYYVDCIMWRLRPSDRQKQATTSHRLCPGASLDQCSCEFHIFIQYIRSLLSFSLVPTPVVANPLILLVDLIPTCAGIVQCKWGYPWSDGNSAPHASTVPHSASVPTMNLDSSGRTCWRAHRHHVHAHAHATNAGKHLPLHLSTELIATSSFRTKCT